MLDTSTLIHKITMNVFAPDAPINHFDWTGNPVKGFVGFGLLGFGLALALLFQKKIGWVIAIVGIAILLVLFHVIPNPF
jgi:hypothetical protein